MRQRIIFFGTGEYTLSVLQMLKEFHLVLIVTTENSGKVEKYARNHNIPYLVTNLNNKEDIQRIKDTKATLGVLASFGAIIPQEVIDLFPNGILNIHPSLLPKYKGPSPIQNTILAGDTTTGVTIIKLDNEIDHGPIAYQVTLKLTGHETTEDLKRELFKIGADLLEQIIKGLEEGKTIEYQDQDHTQESFTEKFENEDGRIDLNNPPNPETLDRMIRAYYPTPGVYTLAKLGTKEKRIKLLPRNKVQVEGKNIMTTQDFINGYQNEAEDILQKLALSKV